jgi:hypothetical protein
MLQIVSSLFDSYNMNRCQVKCYLEFFIKDFYTYRFQMQLKTEKNVLKPMKFDVTTEVYMSVTVFLGMRNDVLLPRRLKCFSTRL